MQTRAIIACQITAQIGSGKRTSTNRRGVIDPWSTSFSPGVRPRPAEGVVGVFFGPFVLPNVNAHVCEIRVRRLGGVFRRRKIYNVQCARGTGSVFRPSPLPPFPRSATLGCGPPSSTSTPPRHVRGGLYTNGRAGRASVVARARTPSAKRPRVRAPSRNAAMRQPSADVHATGEDRRPIDRSSLPDAFDRARPFRSAADRHGVRRFGDADADGRRDDGEQSKDGNTAG